MLCVSNYSKGYFMKLGIFGAAIALLLLVSTYFMPEPLIFYCAVAAQLSLLSITLAYQMATGLEWLKNLCIGFVRSVGTPQTNACSVIVLVILGLVSIPVIALSVLAMVSGK